MATTDPPLTFRGKAVVLTFASTVVRAVRQLAHQRVADLLRRLEGGSASEEVVVMAIPLEILKLRLVAEVVARTPERIAFRLSRL